MIGVNKVANWKYECIVILALHLPDQQCNLSHCFQIPTLLEFFSRSSWAISIFWPFALNQNNHYYPLFNHDQYQPFKSKNNIIILIFSYEYFTFSRLLVKFRWFRSYRLKFVPFLANGKYHRPRISTISLKKRALFCWQLKLWSWIFRLLSSKPNSI